VEERTRRERKRTNEEREERINNLRCSPWYPPAKPMSYNGKSIRALVATDRLGNCFSRFSMSFGYFAEIKINRKKAEIFFVARRYFLYIFIVDLRSDTKLQKVFNIKDI